MTSCGITATSRRCPRPGFLRVTRHLRVDVWAPTAVPELLCRSPDSPRTRSSQHAPIPPGAVTDSSAAGPKQRPAGSSIALHRSGDRARVCRAYRNCHIANVAISPAARCFPAASEQGRGRRPCPRGRPEAHSPTRRSHYGHRRPCPPAEAPVQRTDCQSRAGNDQMAWMWSGSTQIATVSNGRRLCTDMQICRKRPISRTSRSLDLPASATVKKNTPSAILARR
jgi:hypothetical protein